MPKIVTLSTLLLLLALSCFGIAKIDLSPLKQKGAIAYFGDFPTGKGGFTLWNGSHYKGGLNSTLMHGKGVYVSQFGTHFEGNYKWAYRHGKGTFTYSDGRKLITSYQEGRPHGPFKILNQNDEIIEEGFFENGARRNA